MTAGEHRLALPAGYQLGKYRFQEILGAGGFGITYLAEDGSLHRRVAIKELLPNDIATRLDGSTVVAKTKSEEGNLAWARDRFIKEGQALAACEHANVVHVYEMIEANGTAYMVTKFEEGRSFSAWLKEVEGAPTEKELRSILIPLLSGLEKVHRAGFLHRDLKPENIYLTDDGRPILLDFGSARQAITDRTTSLTSIVTSGYAPFEQYHEDGKQGAWTDIYAMAAVIYRAIHGKKPPEATRRLKDDPCLKLAKTYAGQYSAPFLQAIDKGLAVEAKARPQSVAEWKTLLGSEPIEPLPSIVPWWEPWLARGRELSGQAQQLAQQGIALARARPEWAAGGAVSLLILSLLVWKLTDPKPGPVLPTPAPTTPDPTPATPKPSTPKQKTIWDGMSNAYGQTPGPTTPTPWTAGPQAGQKWQNSLGMVFAQVPGLNAHLGIWETRRGDFQAFVQATGYNATVGVLSPGSKGWAPQGASWVNPGFAQTPLHPVVAVSAYDAQAFCRWLTEKERREGRLDARLEYRLPTDVEWTTAAGSNMYPWGEWPPTVGAGNYAGEEAKTIVGRTISGYRDTFVNSSPVGTFQANARGFFDLGGNVIEWVGGWYNAQLNAGEIRQREPVLNNDGGGGRFLILRGGSYLSNSAEMMLTATHDFAPPNTRYTNTGFRCVVAPLAAQGTFTLPPLAESPETPTGDTNSEMPVERKLVAIWDTKMTVPGGSAAVRWEQNADGRYTVTTNGTTTDTGTLTAADGRLHQKSEISGLETDVAYQFKSTYTVVTSGPLGTATWKRFKALPMPAEDDQPAAADDKDPNGGNGRGGNGDMDPKPKPKPKPEPSIRREIQRRLPFRLPF